MRHRASSFGGVIALLAVASAPASAAAAEPARFVHDAVKRWWGAETTALLADAAWADIVRVDPDRPPAGDKARHVGPYRTVGSERRLAPELVTQFTQALLDPDSYEQSSLSGRVIKLCAFQPAVAIRFWPKPGAKPRRPVEVLLCFQCQDLATVSGAELHGGASFSPAATRLLALSAGALPEFTELADELAERQRREAGELLFASLFPPELQVRFTPLFDPRLPREQEQEADGTLLRQRIPERELVPRVTRALGLKNDSWIGGSRGTDAVFRAVGQLSDAQLVARLEALRGDPVALAGAGELLIRGLPERLTPAQRMRLLQPTIEPLLSWDLAAPRCALVNTVAGWREQGVPLLLKIFRDEIPMARPFRRGDREPSVETCALVALLRLDRKRAVEEMRAWHPTAPLDVAVARTMRAQLGEGDAADPALFKTRSPYVAIAALEAYRARPSVAAIDVLVAHGLADESEFQVRERAAAVFTAVTGFTPDLAADEDKRVAAIRAWWTDHRAGWRPPAAP